MKYSDITYELQWKKFVNKPRKKYRIFYCSKYKQINYVWFPFHQETFTEEEAVAIAEYYFDPNEWDFRIEKIGEE